MPDTEAEYIDSLCTRSQWIATKGELPEPMTIETVKAKLELLGSNDSKPEPDSFDDYFEPID